MLSSTACPVNSGKSHFTGKQLLVLFVLLFTVLFSYTVVAQELGLIKKGIETSFPEKIHKLVLDPLPAGTYSVGNGGYFPTIDSAFNKLSMDGVSGTVTLELINTVYISPTNSYGFFVNGPIPGAGPNSRVTIKPAANKNVTIEGDGGSVISFLNTNYVTVDGVGLTGTTTLTIHTVYNNTFSYNDGIDFLNNSDHNVIQNIIFICEDYTRLGGGPGFFNPSSSAFACDSNLIQNNYIKKAGWAIVISSQFSTVRATGNIIRGNIVGSENDSLISQGIQLVKCQNTIVENNIVQNIRFLNNNITIGIISYWGNGDIIRNNIIHNVYANSGAWGSEGILLAGASGQEGANNLVYNNMVYDIRSSAVQTNCSVDGIGMWRQINPKIYYNSVYLSGNGNGANPLGSQALAIWNNCTNVDARNNIFVNTRNESPFRASAIQINSGSSLNTSNFNDLYYSTGTNNCLVRMYGVNYNTLADWQATGHDLNSITEMPNFALPDLHIDWNISTLLDGHATPISGITTDIDNEPRNAATPDIGADEFVIVPVELTSFTATANGKEVILNWSTATELNNQRFEIQRSTEGEEFFTVGFVNGHGTTTEQQNYNYADRNLDDGKYYYRLKQIDYDGSYEYSDVVEVDFRAFNSYLLEQNYPNPFNPATTIKYDLPNTSDVSLIIYDILGRKVKGLVSTKQQAGRYEVQFDASNIACGVYIYQLIAEKFISSRKMILLK